MPPAAAIFELTLLSTTTDGTFRVVADWTSPGELPRRSEGALSLDADDRADLVADSLFPAAYGAALGKKVFSGKIHDLFVTARAVCPTLRLLLAVEATPLQALRWEWLCAPIADGEWDHLRLHQRTPFSLYLPSTTDRRFPPFGSKDLRALVVVANPESGCGYVDPFDEAQALDTVLQGLGSIPSVVLGTASRAKGPPSLRAICEQLVAERFTMLHLVCHGALKRSSGETVVILHGDDGKIEPVDATTMRNRLRELGGTHGLPHFAFLSVCDSAKPEAEAALGGLGQRLVRELGMPAVVAMTGKVTQATALALSTAFYPRLREHGHPDLALAEACVAVRERHDVVVPALLSRLGGRPLFTDDLDRPLTPAEIAGAARMVPVLFQERAPALTAKVRALTIGLDANPNVLAAGAARDREQAIAELEQLCDSALELSFSVLAHGVAPPRWDVTCPFPGMRAFTTNERRFFRGRGELVEKLRERLRDHPFLAVLGNSGCGKSSLVKAGLIPALLDENKGLRAAEMRPGATPRAALTRARAELDGAADAVLYVDQFEESFTLCTDATERHTFFDDLLAFSGPRRHIILSMRADFIGDCATHEGLRREVEGLKLIPPMSADELRNAVVEQAKEAGLEYETGLCELILVDLKEAPGAMPLLQHALRALYERRHGRRLRVAAYEELGRVRKAITSTAERVWEKLADAPDDRVRLREIMLQLTDVQDQAGGAAARYSRRCAALSDLHSIPPQDEDAVRRLVNLLADEYLLVKTGDTVEVAHEALIHGWERLQGWLIEARDALRMRKDMEIAAEGWRKNRQPTYLAHVKDRGVAVRALVESGALRLDRSLAEYFAACEAEERRQWKEKEEQLKRTQELLAISQKNEIAARDALLLAIAQARKEDPTEATVILRESSTTDAPLWIQSASEVLRTDIAKFVLHGHESGILAIAFSPDGTKVVSGSEDGTTRIWNADGTGTSLVLRGHKSDVMAIAVTPDGTRVVSGSADATIRIWNINGAGEPHVIAGHSAAVSSVALSSDGAKIFSGSCGNNAIRVWSTDCADESRILHSQAVVVHSLAVSRDGTKLVSGSRYHEILVWNADGTGKPLALSGHEEEVFSVAFSPDGARIVSGARDNTIRVWNTDGSGNPRVLRGHTDAVSSVAFSPDGTKIVSGSWDHTVRIWDADCAGAPQVLSGHAAAVLAVSFSPDGTKIASASRDKTVRVWSIDVTREPRVLADCADRVCSVAFYPDGKKIVSGLLDKNICVWHADGNGEPDVLSGHDAPVTSVASSLDGTKIASGSEDKTVRLWSAHDISETRTFFGHAEGVTSVAFNPGGTKIASGSFDNTLRVWSADGLGEHLVLCGHADGVQSVAFSPDGTKVVSGSYDKTIRVWAIDAPDEARVLTGHESLIYSVAFSPDGNRIASGSHDKTVRLWSIDGIGQPCILLGHEDTVYSVAFSPDGKRIVSGSRDKTIRIWSVGGHSEPRVLLGHTDAVFSVAFSPDGTQVISGSEDGSIRIWTIDGNALRDLLWSATSYCIPPDRRRTLLLESPEDAQINYARCLAHKRGP